MQESQAKDWALCVAVNDDLGYAKIMGRATHHVSVPLKEFAKSIFEADPPKRLLLDLNDVRCLDSTFMGVLVGLQEAARDIEGGDMILLNVCSRSDNTMRTMGLHFILTWFPSEELPEEYESLMQQVPACENLSNEPLDVAEVARHMLEAHQKLSEVNEENRLRFKDVIEYLVEDIERHGGEE